MREQLGEYRYPQELARKKVKINDSCITSCNYQENLLMLQPKKSSMLNEDKKKCAKWAWLLSTKYKQKKREFWEKRCQAKFSKSKYSGSNDREVIM